MHPCTLRLIGAVAAGGGLIVAIILVTLITREVPLRLVDALIFVTGYLCREAPTWRGWGEERRQPPPAEVKS